MKEKEKDEGKKMENTFEQPLQTLQSATASSINFLRVLLRMVKKEVMLLTTCDRCVSGDETKKSFDKKKKDKEHHNKLTFNQRFEIEKEKEKKSNFYFPFLQRGHFLYGKFGK